MGARGRRRRAAFPPEPGEPIEVSFVEAAFGGDSVGRLPDGRVVFAPRLLPGEEAMVRIVEDRKDYARAELDQLKRVAPERVEARCPYFTIGCGGCSWQHAEYQQQLDIKRRIVVQQLKRIGHFENAEQLVAQAIGMVDPWHYRNQARFTVGHRYGELCFTYRGTHKLLKVDHCFISHPAINEALEILQGKLVGVERRIHQIGIRVGANTGQLLITPSLPDILKIETGQAFLEEELLGRRFRMHPSSFFQVNTRRELRDLPKGLSRAWLPIPDDGVSMAELLALLVIDRIAPTGKELVIDAYGGVGTFAALMSPLVESVVGIEEAQSAVIDADYNARDLPNVRSLQGKTEIVLPQLALERRPDAVVLDPARVGAHPAVLEALLAEGMRPPKLVYVSCDPSTLARDLRILTDGGYTLESVQPLDMFPHTYHVECVALLTL